MRRRQLLKISSAFFLAPMPTLQAKPGDAEEAILEIVGNRTVNPGRVGIELAPLIENGNSVYVKFWADSPMTMEDYVKAIHIVSEGNPLARVISCFFGPNAGKAMVSTRIRLAESQRVWAIAEFSDGSVWRTHADTVVTLSACTEMV